VMAY